MNEHLGAIESKYVVSTQWVGSSYTVGGDKWEDIDALVLVLAPTLPVVVQKLETKWENTSIYYDGLSSQFVSLKKYYWTSHIEDDFTMNLIITQDPKFYKRFCLANEVCKLMKPVNKDDRIAIHDLILTTDI